MQLLQYLSAPICIRIVLTMVHFLWLGTAIMLLGLLALRLIAHDSAVRRYRIHLLTMLAMLIGAIVTFTLIRIDSRSVTDPDPVAGIEPIDVPVPILIEPVPHERTAEAVGHEDAVGSDQQLSPSGAGGAQAPAHISRDIDWEPIVPFAMALYVAGVTLMLVRLGIGLRSGWKLRRFSQAVNDTRILQALQRQAERLAVRATPLIAYCRRVMVPTVVGVIRPLIVLPIAFGNTLTTQQVEMILAHELAHIRRWDPLINVLQSLIEAILFFHPAVWFISHRIRIERENCCDDIVLSGGGSSTDYASSLVRMAEQALSIQTPTHGLGVLGKQSALGKRIHRLLGIPRTTDVRPASRSSIWLTVGIMLLSAALLSMSRANNNPSGEPSWGQTLNGLRMRATAPTARPDGVVVYRHGDSVPLELEIQNVTDEPISLSRLFSPLSFKVTDLSGERIGVQGYLGPHVTSWQMNPGALKPNETIRDTVYLERMRWRCPTPAPRKFNILMQLPTQRQVPNELPINAYANPITVELKDSPFEHPLTSAGLPDSWPENMTIEYREGGMFFGNMGIRIESSGRVVTACSRLRDGELLPNGRSEYVLSSEDLNELTRALKTFGVEQLNPFNGKMYATDLVHIHLCIAVGGRTLVGEYEVFSDKTPEVVAFRELMRRVLAKMAPVEKRFDIYLLKDPEIELPAVRDANLSELVLQDKPWIAMDNIERFDTSSNCLYLKNTPEGIKPKLRGLPFVITADGKPRRLGALWTGFSSFSSPEDIPLIQMPPILWPADVLLIDQMPKDPPITEIFDRTGILHKGLTVSLDTVKVTPTDQGSTVEYTYTIQNLDTDSLYVLDPDRMGVSKFHWFHNGVGLKRLGGNAAPIWPGLTPLLGNGRRQGFSETWFTLLESGESMTRVVRLPGYPPIEDGQYECMFFFCSPGRVLTKQRRDRTDGRIWVGSIRAATMMNVETNPRESTNADSTGDWQIEAGFTPDDARVMLGEPVYVTFNVKNLSDQPFEFTTGGANRGSVRDNNFRITAVDEIGRAVKDPHSYQNFGGLGGFVKLEKGQSYQKRLFLGYWCKFEKQGRYLVTCTRVLNENERGKENMRLEVTSTFALIVGPTVESKMQDVIARWGRQFREGQEKQRIEAAEALSNIDHPDVIPWLAEILEQGDYRSQIPAIGALVRLQATEAPTLIAERLSDRDNAVRSSTAHALGQLKAAQMVDRLVQCLGDESYSVRQAVVLALGEIGDRTAVESLRKRLDDPDMYVRFAIVEALVKLGEPFEEELVTPIILSKHNIFQNAIWCVRRNAGDQAPMILARCLDLQDPSVSSYYNYTLVWQIGACGGPSLKYHHDFDGNGTPEQVLENREILRKLHQWLEDGGSGAPDR